MAKKKTTDEDEDQTAGGAGEESEEDDEDQTAGGVGEESDEDDEDEDDEEAVLATLTPAQAKVFARIQDQLSKANASSARRRKALQAFRTAQGADGAKPAPKPGPPKTDDGKNGTKPTTGFDPEEFRAQLMAELRAEQQAEKIQTTAEKKLRAAGLILPAAADAAERKLKRVMAMLDLKNIEPDEVEDEIDDLKRDSPELFGKVKTKRPAAGGVGGPARVAGNKATATGKISELFD